MLSSKYIEPLSAQVIFIDFETIQASDYGIPQNRRRVFFFGVREDHSFTDVQKFFDKLLSLKCKENYVLKDALFGLRELTPNPIKNKTEINNASSGFSKEKILFSLSSS